MADRCWCWLPFLSETFEQSHARHLNPVAPSFKSTVTTIRTTPQQRFKVLSHAASCSQIDAAYSHFPSWSHAAPENHPLLAGTHRRTQHTACHRTGVAGFQPVWLVADGDGMGIQPDRQGAAGHADRIHHWPSVHPRP